MFCKFLYRKNSTWMRSRATRSSFPSSLNELNKAHPIELSPLSEAATEQRHLVDSHLSIGNPAHCRRNHPRDRISSRTLSGCRNSHNYTLPPGCIPRKFPFPCKPGNLPILSSTELAQPSNRKCNIPAAKVV